MTKQQKENAIELITERDGIVEENGAINALRTADIDIKYNSNINIKYNSNIKKWVIY